MYGKRQSGALQGLYAAAVEQPRQNLTVCNQKTVWPKMPVSNYGVGKNIVFFAELLYAVGKNNKGITFLIKQLQHTPLYEQHLQQSGRMIEFAQHSLPVFYEKYGAIAEHLWTRTNASLFDVSHMCQLEVLDDDETVANILETITPSVFKGLGTGKAKYTLLLNESGGIIDDFIVTKLATGLYHLVVNASCATKDLVYLHKHFGNKIRQLHKSLLALQGPKASEVLAHTIPGFECGLRFTATTHTWGQADLLINRTGYTGEDGVEISIDNQHAPELWDALLSNPDVHPSGLAARNSLRLEAGYPLYGSDINEDTSPIEANLGWLVKNLSCYGGKKIAHQMLHGTEKKRVGFKLDSKRIPRNHNEIFNSCNETIGQVTSAAFLPGKNFVAGQALVNKPYAIGDPIGIKIPGGILSGNICKLSFL